MKELPYFQNLFQSLHYFKELITFPKWGVILFKRLYLMLIVVICWLKYCWWWHKKLSKRGLSCADLVKMWMLQCPDKSETHFSFLVEEDVSVFAKSMWKQHSSYSSPGRLLMLFEEKKNKVIQSKSNTILLKNIFFVCRLPCKPHKSCMNH